MTRIALAATLLLPVLALQAKQYSFKLYTRRDGLRNQTINCLLQDRTGFLWAGTDNGLYRYDGSRFTFFSRADGLPDETIQAIYEAGDGTLWVGTRLGVASFDGKRSFIPDPVIGRAELFGYSGIVADAEGNLYVGTAKGLAIRQRRSDPGTSQMAPPGAPGFQFLTTSAVHGVYLDSSNHVWFGADQKLWRIDDGVPVDIGKDSKLPADRWDSILEDRQGTLWVRSSERLFSRKSGSDTFQPVPGIAHSPEFGSLSSTRDGDIWVPTSDGLMRYSRGHWEQIGTRQGLTSNETTCLMQDREGSVWVGLGGEGLERWLGYSQVESWTTADGLSSGVVWDIQRDSKGTLWLATEQGLDVQDPKTGRWLLKTANGLSVRTVLEDAAHQAVWFGANPGGVYRLDRTTGLISHFGPEAGLTSNRVDKLLLGPGNSLWVTTRAGLFRAKFTSNAVRFERQEPPYTDGNEAFFGGLMDSRGRLWVGGSRGVVVLDHGQWRRISTSDGLAGEGVSHLTEAPDGAMWLGYLPNMGISRLVLDHDRVRINQYNIRNGLTSNGTVFVNVDSRGWLWVGSDDGVDIYANSVWRHLGTTDGLVSDDCDSLAFHEDPDGSIWIGTSSGVSHLQGFSNQAPQASQVYITALTAGNRSLDVVDPGPISYQDRSLLFNFAAPTFVNESAIRFRYRMVGLGQNWVDADERWARYPNLAAGDYEFQVMAQTDRGEWSPRSASLKFRILPPWWQTWKTRTLGGILLAVLAHLFWKFRIRYLMKRQAILETLLSQAQTANLLKSEALEKMTRGEARERNRSQVLEHISSQKPLDHVLNSIIEMVEQDDDDTLCLILIIQDEGVRHVASRRFPPSIAELFGSFASNLSAAGVVAVAGTAETNHIFGLKDNPIWADYVDALAEIGITSARSAPILSSSSDVLGSITYFRREGFPDQFVSLPVMESAERLASVAIEYVSLYEQLSYRARYDLLTGLPNRAFFHERLQKAIARADRENHNVCVLWLDLDGFKHVNDTLGHESGDLLLKEVASRISGCLRREDTAARMGGDEFTVILQNIDDASLDAVIQRLISAISSSVYIGKQTVLVTASIGVSRYPDDSRNAGDLIKYADAAMYHVKRLGKNAHQYFLPEMENIEASRIEMEACLRNALVNSEFELHYQPQFRRDGSLASFEALLRWNNPKLGSVSPMSFIPIAESTGLIVPIGQWVMEEACRQIAEWNAAGFRNFRVAINVSAFQLAMPDLPASVAHVLETSRVAPEQLELELTETAIMNDVAKSSGRLRQLRELGVTIAIDDFGTGYSSLSYLQQLPVDVIKIDRSFVRDIGIAAQSLTMIEAIVALAHGLGLRIVAEGVETEEQLRILRNLGCDLAQGFLLDKPLTRLHAAQLLADRNPRSGSEFDPIADAHHTDKDDLVTV